MKRAWIVLTICAIMLLAACSTETSKPAAKTATSAPTGAAQGFVSQSSPTPPTTVRPSAVPTPARTPQPTPPRTPAPTPAPPTPEPVPGATFVVNTLAVGCHTAPTAAAAVAQQRAIGTVQAMDQLIRQPDGVWHREVSQQCWTRTDPGPVRVFPSVDAAETFARTVRPTPPPTPAPTVRPPTPAPAPVATRGNCSPSYPDVCIPPAPPDLDCRDVPYRRFRVLPPDPHRFDNDRDGIGCER